MNEVEDKADIETLITTAADRRDLTYAEDFNGRAYALMDMDWIGYFDTLDEVLKYLGISKDYELALAKEQINKYEKALSDVGNYLKETYEESDLRKSEDDFALGAYNTCKAIYDILEENDIVFEEDYYE